MNTKPRKQQNNKYINIGKIKSYRANNKATHEKEKRMYQTKLNITAKKANKETKGNKANKTINKRKCNI